MNMVSGRRAIAAFVVFSLLFPGLPLASLAGAAPQPTTVTASDETFPQFGFNAAHSFTPNVTGRGYNDSIIKWKLPLALSAASTGIANFSSDVALNNTTSKPAVLGVVLGHPSGVVGTSLVTIVAGNNGTTMWSYPVLGNLFAAPAVADVNLDGKMDLVIRSDNGLLEAVTPNITWDGSNYLFPATNLTDIQAQQLWNRSLAGSASTNNNLSMPIAVNIVGSAAPEILAPAGDRLYYLSGVDGSEIRNQTVDGTIVSAPTAFQAGGGWRILVASTNRTTANVTTVSSDFIVTAFDASLNFLWNRSFPQSYSTALGYKSLDLQLPSPAAGNLDGAGPADDWALVTPYENSVARLRVFYNGSNAFSVNVSLQGLTGAAPAVTDLDGDGTSEVVALSYLPGTPIVAPNSQAYVEVFAGNGTRKWNATIDEVPGAPRENTLAPPAIADIDGDGVKDVIVFLTDGASEVRSGVNGSRILRHLVFDQATPTEFSGPAVGDLDMDGFLDMTGNAAAVSFAMPDLAINASDIAVNNTVPLEFEDVSVTATVHNAGNAGARNVSVEFRDGALLLNQSLIPLIVAGTSAQAQVTVNFSTGGARTLTVRVDPNNTIAELDETNNTASIVLNVTSLYGFHFQSPLNRTVVQPGFSYAFVLNTVSDGTQTDTVTLNATGAPANWTVSVSPSSVAVTAAGTSGDTNTSFVTVTTDPGSLPGEYDIAVGGVSAFSPRNTANITYTVIIGGQFGVVLYPPAAAQNVTAGDTETYTINVTNAGNGNDTFDLTNSSPPVGWQVVLSRSSVSLGGGQSATVFALITASASSVAGDNATVVVTARSRGDPAKNDTTVTMSTVVVPDLVIRSVRFFRECGGESAGGAPRLIQGDNSTIQVTVANAAQNAEISVVHVRVWIEGVPSDRTTRIGANGEGTVNLTYRYTSAGVKVVTATADPTNSVAEVSEANNDLTAQVTVKDNVPVGDLTVSGFVVRGSLSVPGASVWVTDPATGANVSVNATAGGLFTVVLQSTQYFDGDKLALNATDGLDVGHVPPPVLCAYSEDGTLQTNVSLGLPSPYDFLILANGSAQVTAPPGSAASFNVTIVNRGSLNNSILLFGASPWPMRILDASNASISSVLLPPNGTVSVRLEVTVPAGGAPGLAADAYLNGSAAADPQRTRSLAVTATVGILRSLGLTQDAPGATALAGTNVTVNLTVRNLGNADEVVTLSATCAGPSPCSSWATFAFNGPTVPPAGSVTVAATVRISPSAAGGAYTVNFTAAAVNDSSVHADASFDLTGLEVRYDFAVSGTSTVRVVPGETRTANLTVANTGTVTDTYTVSVSPGGLGFAVSLLPQHVTIMQVTVGAGATTVVTLEIRAPREVEVESFPVDLLFEGAGNGKQLVETVTALIGPFYDFRVSGPTFSADPEVDKEIEIYATVANVGLRPFVGQLPVRLIVAGEVVATQTITDLAPGVEQTVVFRWTPRVAGVVNFTVDANEVAGSTIYESSFDNNAASRSASVAPARGADFFSNRSVQLAFVAIVLVLIAAAALARRKDDDEGVKVEHEKAREESEERRVGKGPGGLERL